MPVNASAPDSSSLQRLQPRSLQLRPTLKPTLIRFADHTAAPPRTIQITTTGTTNSRNTLAVPSLPPLRLQRLTLTASNTTTWEPRAPTRLTTYGPHTQRTRGEELVAMEREPGDLTLTGMLYEGNFEDWEPRMMAILRGQGTALTEPEQFALICGMVSPHILFRVPEEERKPTRTSHYRFFIRALKAAAKPFRLLDLPGSVRLRIYSEHLRGQAWTMEIEEDQVFESYNGPGICQASSQLRRETLPLLYKTGISFGLVTDTSEEIGKSLNFLKVWSSSVAGDNIGYMRQVGCSFSSGYKLFHFAYSDDEGLTANFDTDPDYYCPETGDYYCPETDAMKNLVAEHAKDMERVRQTLGLKGEAVMLAVVANPKFWEKLEELGEEVE